jgi:L-histidine N-alpha-methyltransferase
MNKTNKMNYTKEETLTKGGIKLVNYLPDIGIKKVKEEIFNGLKAFPKFISPKFFYDERGSELFEAITKLDEYYPTRTEKKILSTIWKYLNLDFSELSIIELGSGDSSKIHLLLQQISENKLSTIKYYPVDISHSAIEKASEKLTDEFPMLKIQGIVADFIYQLNIIPKTEKRLFCFFGSTIGNLNMSEIEQFMKLLGEEIQEGDSFLLGIDMVKDSAVLEKAYNDDQQITADFNKNILNVINNVAYTNFEPADFEHLAFYNKEKKRIEMHLKAKKDMVITFNSKADKIHIKKGETIHTENSHKFKYDNIKSMGYWAGLYTEKIFTDNNKWFSLVHYKKNK